MSSSWTPSEKKIARRVFDAALQSELDAIMRTVKAMAADASAPDALWAIEEFLSKSRRAIDRKYDYRYSQLEFVFAYLLREGRISEDALAGLSDDKLQRIMGIAMP